MTAMTAQSRFKTLFVLHALLWRHVHSFAVTSISSNLQKVLKLNTLPRQPSALFLSDIPQPQQEERRFELPPPPEDHFVLMGDLLSLATYGFSDHFFCNDMAHFMMRGLDSPQKLYQAAASVPTSGGVLTSSSEWGAPVWLNTDHSFYEHVLHVTLQDRLVTTYSPVLEPVGLATCLLATCWLLAGWWHRAFLFPNTVACSTSRALTKTAQTWLTCTVLMLMTVGVSHTVDTHAVFTRGDVDYILDSLTVLAMWRFLASWLLGTGQDSDS